MVMAMKRRKISIGDVARVAGVSTTTVSRVINEVTTVSPANRQRVLEATRKLNYHPNPDAQRLASGRKNTVGLVIPRFADMFRSFHVSELIKGIGTAVERLKLSLLLHVTDGRSFLNVSHVDGILFADIDGNEDQVDFIMNEGIPCVVMLHHLEAMPLSSVTVANRKASEQIVHYLHKLGHRDIATITGHLRTPCGIDRLDGYLRAMKAENLEVKPHFVQRGDYTGASAREPARLLLTHQDRPTAIFAAGDEMAVTTIDVAQELGLRVPEDLSIIGFDDSPIAAFAKVPLTTVSQPLSRVGELSAELLADLITQKQRRQVNRLLGTKIIERQSCRQTWLDPH